MHAGKDELISKVQNSRKWIWCKGNMLCLDGKDCLLYDDIKGCK